MPKWNPGTLNGNPVRVRFTLPVMVKFGANNTDELKEYLPADQKKIDRINELARKKKAEGLTSAELEDQ